jgi:hypothetical protein
MRKKVSVPVLGTVLVVAFGLCALGIHAQQRGQSAGSGYRMACNVEGLWAEVAFTLKVADAELLKMRPDFQKAWNTRDKLTADITSTDKIMPGIDKLETLGNELVGSVKKSVTEEQFAKLSSWIEEQKSRLEMLRQSAQLVTTIQRHRQERGEQ